MDDLSSRILEFITTFVASYGYSPTVREICDGTASNPATIHRRLQVLRDEDRVTFQPTTPRTIRVLHV